MGDKEAAIVFLTFSIYLLVVAATSADAYKNYTVGGSLGWFDSQEKPDVDYQSWADAKTFTLGDFLIFNTDNNHSVIQTYNITTYKLCDYDDDLTNDTVQWSTSNPSAVATQAVTVSVPLLKEGPTYFFSGDYDGDQCKNGQHFKINVTHGQGLPESLKEPSDASPGPAGAQAQAGDDDSAPDTIVPANFDHPKEEVDNQDDDDKAASGSVSLLPKFSVALVLFGLFCIF